MAWGTNVFINLWDGAPDARIERQTRVLAQKIGADPGTDIFTAGAGAKQGAVPKGLDAALAALGDSDRLYLRGHGDWRMKTIGGWNAADVCLLLKSAGLKAVGLVSVTACKGARAEDNSETELIGAARTDAFKSLLEVSGYSLAGEIHKMLRGITNVRTVVHGRIYNVDIVEDLSTPQRKAGQERLAAGSKTVRRESGADSRHVHHAPNTKIRFSWAGNTQLCEWVNYGR